jgi:hypothetical protein
MVFFLLACTGALTSKDQVPARLELKVPEGPIYDQAPFDLEPVVLNPYNEPLTVVPEYTLSVPAPLERVGPTSLACRGPGTATVRVSVEKVERIVYIYCKPLGSIAGPDAMSLKVGQREVVRLRANDPQGAPMPEVLPKLRVVDPNIAEVVPGLPPEVEGRAQGSTTLVVTVGDQVVEIPITVEAGAVSVDVELPFTLSEGTGQSWALGAGSWKVGVRVDSGPAVVASGGGCGDGSPKSSHRLQCTGSIHLQNSGAATSRGTVVLMRK